MFINIYVKAVASSFSSENNDSQAVIISSYFYGTTISQDLCLCVASKA